MAYKKQYRLQVKNYEGVTLSHMIYDTLSGDPNPYNISLTVIDIGGGNVLVRCFFSGLPVSATGTTLGYSTDGGATWTDDYVAGQTSPHEITIPNTFQYKYRLIINYADPSLDETFLLDELEGTTIDLQGSGDPLHIGTINNDENEFQVMRGLQVVAKFITDGPDNLNRMLRGEYNERRFYCETSVDALGAYIIFRGFISIADAQEPFLPHPNELVLTATDQLGLLKGRPLVKPDGTNPRGENKLIDYVSWAFKMTGMSLIINVVMNIREEDDGTIDAEPTKNFLNTQYLDAKTFEAEIGESEDAYTVLTKIFGNLAFVGQRHGEWWIKNVDEYDTQPDYVCRFDADGVFMETRPGTYYNKSIGRNEEMLWSKEAHLVNLTAPNKFDRLTFRYEQPKEVPCNSDFGRGDLLATISSTEKHFVLECWTLEEDRPPVTSTHATAYIVRLYDANGIENARYAEISTASSSIEQELTSEAIPIEKDTKFDFQVDVSWDDQVETSGATFNYEIAQIRLYANDGTYYTLHGGDDLVATVPAWVACDVNFNTNQKFFHVNFLGTDDDTQWRTVTYQYAPPPPCPKSGVIKIILLHKYYETARKIRFANLQIDFNYYINKSYQKYTGQSHKVSQTSNAQSLDDEVYMSDAPGRILKGALLKYSGTDYVLSGLFWNAAVFASGPPDPTYLHPFGYIQIFNVWNQNRRLKRIIRGSIQGIESSSVDGNGKSDLPTVFHTYLMTDTDEHTNNKKFMLLSYDIDLYRCEFSNAVFKEVYDSVIGKKYDDTYEFKYLTK